MIFYEIMSGFCCRFHVVHTFQYEEQTVGYKTNLYEGFYPWATTFRLTTTS